MTSIFTIDNYQHQPARRKHRFRCQVCQRLIDDGDTAVVERRPGGAHGYHGDCWAVGGINVQAAKARAARKQ